MFYFFGKGKCTEVFQGIRDITPEVYCLRSIPLFTYVSSYVIGNYDHVSFYKDFVHLTDADNHIKFYNDSLSARRS